MKWRYILVLVLVIVAAGVTLLRFEINPTTKPAGSSNIAERSQVEPGPRRLSAEAGNSRAGQEAASRRVAAATQRDDFSAAEGSASKGNQLAPSSGTFSDLTDDEALPEFYIGGRVQDEEGNPQPHFEVLAERIDGFPANAEEVPAEDEVEHSVFSDSSGVFLFEDLEDAEYRVSLAPVPGVAPAEIRVRSGTLNATLVVVMLRDIRVYGFVKSTDGEPIKDAHIIAGPVTRTSRSGSKGEYELDISRKGKSVLNTILFQHEDFEPQRIQLSSADLDDALGDYQLDVTMKPLDRLTTVSGSLRDTRGDAVIGKMLNIVDSRMQIKYRAESDVRGNFWFDGVEPAKDYQLMIRPGAGYKNKDINPLVVPAGGLTLDIVLELGDLGEISGWMISPDGSPVPGFSMTLHSTVATGESVAVVSDQQGFFSAEDFPIGGAILSTLSDPLLRVQGLLVSAEPEDPVTVVLDFGRHILQGRVIDAFGDPVAASGVTLGWEFRDGRLLFSSSRKTTTDQNGNFVFTDLGPDLHAMEVTATGFRTAVRTIDVGTGQDETLIELEEAGQ